MKIRRFVAPDMRSALQLVREAQGPDAVILSNRRTDEGVEIVAANNYDEAFLQRAIEEAPRETAVAAAPLPATPVAAPAPAAPSAPAVVSPPPRTAAGTDAARGALSPSEHWLMSLQAPAPAQEAPAHAPFEPAAEPVFADMLARGRGEAAAAATAAPPSVSDEGAARDQAPSPADAAAPAVDNARDGIPAPAPAPAPVLTAVPSPPAPASDGELAQMREELGLMREMIEREMARLTDERLRGSPVRAEAMHLMEDYGFDAGITRDVVLKIPADTPEHRARGLMLGLISKRLPVCPVDPLQTGGVIALVGPTGAGKTTTIAKLAALYASQHQPRDVALVTTDTVRVGGREQLHSYGRQLGIAVHEADSEASLLQLLQRLEDYRLVLVDTAGMSQRDRALAGQLNWLRAAREVRTLLVLPANTHFADLDEVVRRFQAARPEGVVLTKLDETGRLGSALSVVADHQLPLTWTTDGQRIPQDLQRANAAHLVLRLEDLRREADKPFVPEHSHATA